MTHWVKAGAGSLVRFVMPVMLVAAWAGTVSASLYARAGWTMDVTGAFHDVAFVATIVDEHTIDVRGFDYDAAGPQVYFWLAPDTGTLGSGIAIGDLLRNNGVDYVHDRVRLTLPEEMSLDGYNALSVWCALFGVNFGAGTFAADPSPPPAGDLNDSGTVDTQDINPFIAALVNLDGYYDAYPDATVVPDLVADINADGLVNTEDINPFIAALTEPGVGAGVGAASVIPEPATAGMVLLLGAAVGCRRADRRYKTLQSVEDAVT